MVIHGLGIVLDCSVLTLLRIMVAAWSSALAEAKIPDEVQSKLLALGYETAESFQFKNEGVFEAFVKSFVG